jgi:hypothetical protein
MPAGRIHSIIHASFRLVIIPRFYGQTSIALFGKKVILTAPLVFINRHGITDGRS